MTAITKQRSLWEHQGITEPVEGYPCRTYRRAVNDGSLWAFVGQEPLGWHMSISHRSNHHPPRYVRYPTWDEIRHARDELLPADVGFVMHLPVADEYVDFHPTTFHLHEYPERS
jgi:hypothetical protein